MLTLNGSGLLQQAVANSASFSDNLPPSNISPPELVGKAEVGTTVSARPGVWAGLPAPRVQTTLFLSGVARRSPCFLGPEDDGKEIIITDAASNDAGEAVVSSSRGFVRHSVPHALGTPEDVSIGPNDDAVVVDAGAFFVGTSGGQWSATCSAGMDALQLDIDEAGRMTLGGGTMTGSSVVSISYSNSGGLASAKFTVSFGETESAAGPKYDGSLGNLSTISGVPVEIRAGLAFSGDNLAFSATGLPDGIAIDPETGRISGLTSKIGSHGVTVVAMNSVGSVSATFELNIAEQSRPLPDAPSYDGSLESEQATLGTNFDLAAGDAFAGDDLTFSATGLAPGLAIDTATGRIAGTPSSEGSFPTIVTAKNSGGEASGWLQIIVTKPEVIVETPIYNGGLSDQFSENNASPVEYDTSVFFSNTEGGIWTILVTPDIAGVSIDPSTGVLKYDPLPLPEGTFGVNIIVNLNGNTATGSFNLVITPEVVAPVDPAVLEPLDYDGGTGPLGPDDLPYDLSQHITGPGTITYAATGLPAGVSINSGSGVISGTFSGSATATITVSNGATPNVTITAGFSASALAAPVYNGLAPATLAPGNLPYDFSQHITGSGVTYSATGLPAGVTLNAGTGVISGAFTDTASATITAANGMSPNATASVGFTDVFAAASATSHDLVQSVNAATLDIGTNDAARRVFATVMVGGTQDAGFSSSGGPTAATLQSFTGFPLRGVQLCEISGATGMTVNATWGGDTEVVATFRTINLRPKTGAIVTKRQNSNNTNSTVLSVTVPIGGALLLHGKRYESFSSSGPTITPDESLGSGYDGGVRGAWLNDTGTEQSFDITFTNSVAAPEKYGLAIIMEPEA